MLTRFPIIRHYYHLLGEQRRRLPRVLLASLIVSFFDSLGVVMVGPLVMSILTPEILTSNGTYSQLTALLGLGNTDPAIVMALALLSASLLKLLVASAVLAEIFSFCAQIDRSLRERLLNRYYTMTLSTLAGTNSSTFVQAVHGYTAQFAHGLVGPQLRLVTELLIGVAILSYLFLLHPLGLGILLSGVVAVIAVYYAVLRKRIQRYGQESALAGELLTRSVYQIVSGMREIQVYGVENRLLAHAKTAAYNFASVSARYQWVSSLPKYAIEFCLIGGISILVITMHGSQVPRDSIFALLSVFGVAVVRLAPVANHVINGLIQIRFNSFVIDRLYELVNNMPLLISTPKLDYEDAAEELVQYIEVIKLDGVNFKYEGQSKPALQDVSLIIHQGESIGLVGPSGGGKTTLAEMILGFWNPSSGDIYINGISRSSLASAGLRQHFAYIPQQLFLLDASIADNISLLDPGPKGEVRQRVLEAAAAAQLSSHLEILPEGLDTRCGENGSKLSGGQRQRIALARAFYHNRSVLVMDEATSALDYDTEQEVIEEIRVLKGHVTMIVIAHRLETVADCDRWFRVEGGRVKEIDRSALGIS